MYYLLIYSPKVCLLYKLFVNKILVKLFNHNFCVKGLFSLGIHDFTSYLHNIL